MENNSLNSAFRTLRIMRWNENNRIEKEKVTLTMKDKPIKYRSPSNAFSRIIAVVLPKYLHPSRFRKQFLDNSIVDGIEATSLGREALKAWNARFGELLCQRLHCSHIGSNYTTKKGYKEALTGVLLHRITASKGNYEFDLSKFSSCLPSSAPGWLAALKTRSIIISTHARGAASCCGDEELVEIALVVG